MNSRSSNGGKICQTVKLILKILSVQTIRLIQKI